MDERELIMRATAGERDAFGELVRRYERPLLAFLSKKVGNRERAMDLVQETLVDALTSLPGLTDPTRFGAWLFTIARRKAWLATKEDRRPLDPVGPVPLTYEGTDPVLRRELAQLVRQAVQSLPKKMRQSVEMHYLQEMPYAEASAELDIPVAMLKSRLHLARERLRDRLAPFFEELIDNPKEQGRKQTMKFAEPEIEITEVPGVTMAVELVEHPVYWVRLAEGAKAETIWFRPAWPEDQVHIKRKVIGRACVEGEECWEIQGRSSLPNGQCLWTAVDFCDHRADGFYSFASVSKSPQGKTEVYCKPNIFHAAFPSHLESGMEKDTSGRGHRLKGERVVDVRINGQTVRTLEIVAVCTPNDHNGIKYLRLDRKYVSQEGRIILSQRFHSLETIPPDAPRPPELNHDLTPFASDTPQIEFEGMRYFRYWDIVPREFLRRPTAARR